jgi:hypothetical protein
VLGKTAVPVGYAGLRSAGYFVGILASRHIAQSAFPSVGISSSRHISQSSFPSVSIPPGSISLSHHISQSVFPSRHFFQSSFLSVSISSSRHISDSSFLPVGHISSVGISLSQHLPVGICRVGILPGCIPPVGITAFFLDTTSISHSKCKTLTPSNAISRSFPLVISLKGYIQSFGTDTKPVGHLKHSLLISDFCFPFNSMFPDFFVFPLFFLIYKKKTKRSTITGWYTACWSHGQGT